MSDEREQRNQVFAAAAPQVDPRIPTVSAVDKVKAEFGVDIPVELVPLPSGGKVYPPAHPFHGKDRIEIRAMTAREEDILTNSAFLKKGTVITELIKSCLVDRNVNPRELLTGDRNALMVAIRVTGYGHEYDAEVECNECGAKTNQQFNLAQLPIDSLGIDPIEPGVNLFEFRLPYSKKVVKFRFMTGQDEEEIVATQAKQKKLGLQAEASVTTSLLYSIVSIDGVDDRSKIAGFARMMPARDSLALRNYIKANEPGIRMKQETTCTACGHTDEAVMPIGIQFLWPGAGR